MGWPGPMTHRQFLLWQEWLDSQWNTPSKSDWYMMAVAYQVYLSRLSEKATPEPMSKFIIKFTRKRQGDNVLADEERARLSKEMWLGLAGITQE